MNSKTLYKRYDALLRDISIHPHKDELLTLMYQQVQDELDTPTTLTKVFKL